MNFLKKEEKRKRTDDDLFNEIMKIEHKKQMELKKMDLQKSKLIVIVPIVVSILAATFGSVRYIINLTDTIEANNQQVILLNKDIQIIFDKYAQDKEEFTREMFNVNARVTEVNAYFRALEEILRKTTDSVRDQQWDIKDLQREVLGD